MKTSSSVLSAVVVSVLGLSATLSAPQAFALEYFGDYKVYPGTTCVKLPGGPNMSRYLGSVRNESPTASLVIECNVVNNVYLPINSGWIQTTDRNPLGGSDIACDLWQVMRRYQDSAIVFWNSGWKQTAGATENVQVLYYDRADPNAITGSASHNFYLCVIPPAYNGAVSEIHSYSINEKP